MGQEFDKNKLDLVKQKELYPYEYMTDFEKFKEQLPGNEKFYSFLTGKKVNDKEYEQIFEWLWNKNDERSSQLVLKVWRFIISWCISKFVK